MFGALACWVEACCTEVRGTFFLWQGPHNSLRGTHWRLGGTLGWAEVAFSCSQAPFAGLDQRARSSELSTAPCNLSKAPPLGERKSQRGAFGPEKPQILWFFRFPALFRGLVARVVRLSDGQGSASSGRRRWCPCRAPRVWRPVSRSRERLGPPHRCPNRPT